MRGSGARLTLAAYPDSRGAKALGAAWRTQMQYASRLPHPTRAIVIPLMAGALGAGVATATFAVVNIDDDPSVSLPTPAVQSTPPSDAVAAQRTDGGPEEGTAQQSMSAGSGSRGSKASPRVDAAPRHGGGPDESATASTLAESAAQSPEPVPAGGVRP
jgi:hypothetical protein